MRKRSRRVSTRVHDRKIDRLVAKYKMKKAGVPKPNKQMSKDNSDGTKNWREWAVAGEEKR